MRARTGSSGRGRGTAESGAKAAGAASLCSRCHSQAQPAPRRARAVPKVCFCLDQTLAGGGGGWQGGGTAGSSWLSAADASSALTHPQRLSGSLCPGPSETHPRWSDEPSVPSVKQGHVVSSHGHLLTRGQASSAWLGLHQGGRVSCGTQGAQRQQPVVRVPTGTAGWRACRPARPGQATIALVAAHPCPGPTSFLPSTGEELQG